jgi:uncharacterized damage-inducible protein DinB
MRFAIALSIALAAASPLGAQSPAGTDSLLLPSIHVGASYIEDVIVKSAERMSDEDYAFRPTPEVRSFAQLIGHITDTNYIFCSIMKGEKNPVESIEKTKTTRADLRRSLAESFEYCKPVLLAMNGPRGREIVKFQGYSTPAVVVMNYRSYHALLHYGNVITYMRLRGRIPPSTSP